jgi:hypothetical protein
MIPIAALLSIGEKVLDKVLPDPAAKAEAQAKLMEMAQKGQLAELEFMAKEMDSARRREIEIAVSKVVTPILALGTVGLTFILFTVIIFVDVNAQSKDILVYVLGGLTSAMTMVLGYYFGSSAGSKEKTKQIDDLLEKK